MPKRVRRSFSACWTCRRRRVACDGELPACSPCLRLSLNCEGYAVQLVWVDSHKGTYSFRSRRYMDPCLTWTGQSLLDHAQLEHLLDPDGDDLCRCDLHTSRMNPFIILKTKSLVGHGMIQPLPSCEVISSGVEVATPSGLSCSTLVSSPSRSNRPWMEEMLLDHFVRHVAFLMVPVDSNTNPWRSTYPSIATRSSSHATKSLYEALLSQSAFNLSSLYAKTPDQCIRFRMHAMQHFGQALRALRQSLEAPENDSVACAAVLLTLVQIEVNMHAIRAWNSD